jgi:hypothetical protein
LLEAAERSFCEHQALAQLRQAAPECETMLQTREEGVP